MCPSRTRVAIVAITAALAVTILPPPGLTPAPAPANASLLGKLTGTGCGVLGKVGEGWWSTACNGASKVLGVGGGKAKQVAGVLGKVASNPLAQRAASLAAITAWVLGGARWTMSHVATAISQSTAPALSAAWFSTVYLRVEAIAWLLALPFLAAAAAQAVLRGELGLLARAAFGYLPLAALLTGLAVPITMLLLSVTDAASSVLAQAAGQDGTHFLTGTSAWVVGGLSLADPFVAVVAGLVLVVAGLALWTEMVVRELAVYVVVLMLPLVFCAMVWPARRVWAIRAAELLVALILAKFAIIVPLALGAAALAHGGAGSGVGRMIAGLALVGIGCLAPWVLLRLMPLAEVAAAAVGHVRGQMHAHAGVPTPEAAVASNVAQRLNRSPTASHEHSDIHELLHNMVRRAELADPAERETAVAGFPAGSSAGAQATGSRAAGGPEADRRREPADGGGQAAAPGPTAGAAIPSAQGATTGAGAAAAEAEVDPSRPGREGSSASARSARGSDAEAPTMVQQADGSWEPMRFGDPNAPVPPPPWEQQSEPATAPEDPDATSTPRADPHALAPPDQEPDRRGPQPGEEDSDGGP
jgi:hypothetical protein